MHSLDCDKTQMDKFHSVNEIKDVYYLEKEQNILVNNIYLNPIIKNKKTRKHCRLHCMENVFLKNDCN